VDIAFREVACARDADPTFVLVNASLGHKRWPTFSPDGKTLAYASCSESGCDSWLQDLSTSEIVKLAPVRSAPSFSPDGKSLAFAGEGGVDVLALDGRTLDERTIRHFPAPVHDARVAWSPAGETVVFSEQGLSPGDSSRSGIWEGEPASRRVRLLSDIDARDIAYSPHGSRIACVSRRGGTRDLWTMSSKGAEPVRLTSDADAEWSPFWSPDGTRLYFGSDRGGTPRLWSVRIDESSGRSSGVPTPALNIAFPGTFYATPSADGSRMAIVTEEHPGRIFRLPLDPVSGTLAASPQALPDYPGGLMHPDLSPDQKQLVCLCADQHDLGILTADGSGQPRRLMNDAYQDESPRWSPDGERIAFHSNRSGGVEIWTIRPDGTDLRQITRNTHGGASSPVWSPDGNRLAFHANGGSAFLISARSGDRNSQPEALPSLGSQTFEPWSWSPDGETLAGSADGLGVYLYSIRKRTFRRITDFGGHPIWLPDGRRLVFVGERKIFLIDIAGGEPREIYAAAPAALRPYLTVSADGRSIFTSLNASDGSIWVSPAPN
jgi:TolB protein